MKITSKEIQSELTAVWPDLEYIWKWDGSYWKPSPSAVQKALELSNVPKMDFIDEFNDCDDFGLQFLAECRRKRYMQWKAGELPEDQRYPMSIGFVFGDMFRGMSKRHVANIALCNDSNIYIVDATPGENRMWQASAENDNILFVFM